MVRKHRLHFSRHIREAEQTRRRFLVLLSLMFVALLSVVAADRYVAVHAGSPVTVSGRVYNATSGAGYANVTVYFCGTNGTVATDVSGVFHKDLAQNTGYCVRVSSLPYSTVGLSGPKAINNNASTIGANQASYENQVAGANCFGSAGCSVNQQKWDRNFQSTTADTGYDLVYTGSVAPTAAVVAKVSTPAPAAAGDKSAPSVPGNFQATVGSSNATVSLSWDASTASAGIKEYALDRSIDQSSWTNLSSTLTATAFADSAVDYDVHYYYRLRAIDQAGNSSGYATTDASTGGFTTGGSSGGGGVTTASSDDGVAVVEIPDGAYDGEADCTVTLVADAGAKDVGSVAHPVAAGPYALICKTLASQLITTFSKPVTWTYNLKGKLAGLNNPVAFSFPSGDNATAVSKQSYDSAAGVLKFTMASSDNTVILASKVQGVSVNLLVALLVVVLIVVGLAILMARTTKRHTYDEYLRRKYYNL